MRPSRRYCLMLMDLQGPHRLLGDKYSGSFGMTDINCREHLADEIYSLSTKRTYTLHHDWPFNMAELSRSGYKHVNYRVDKGCLGNCSICCRQLKRQSDGLLCALSCSIACSMHYLQTGLLLGIFLQCIIVHRKLTESLRPVQPIWQLDRPISDRNWPPRWIVFTMIIQSCCKLVSQ